MKKFFAFGLFLLAGLDLSVWAKEPAPSFPSTGTTVPRELTDDEADLLQEFVKICENTIRAQPPSKQVSALNSCVRGWIEEAQAKGQLPKGPLEIRFTEMPPANGGF